MRLIVIVFEAACDDVIWHPHLVHLGSTATGEDVREAAEDRFSRTQDARWADWTPTSDA